MCAGEVSNLSVGRFNSRPLWLVRDLRGYCLCLVGKIVAKHFRVAVWVASHRRSLAPHVIRTKERVTKPQNCPLGRLQSWVLTKPVYSELFCWENVAWIWLPLTYWTARFIFTLFFSFPFYRKSIECNLADLSGISLSEVEEGNEPDEFWKAIGGKKYYCSLAHGKYAPPTPPPFTPFFHF